MRSWRSLFALALAIVVGWLVNITAWPWHVILQWSGGLSSLVLVAVTLNAIYRENSKRPQSGDDNFVMFIAILALLTLTISSLANFLLFVLL